MELVCPPWLSVERGGAGEVRLRDAALQRSFTVDSSLGSLLEQLREPIGLAELTGGDQAAIPETLVGELMRAGYLAQAGGPLSVAGLLTPFQPAFLACPDSGPGTAQVSLIGMPCEAQSTTGNGPGEGPAALRLASEFAEYQTGAGGPLGFFDYESETRMLEGVSMRDLGNIQAIMGEAAEAPGERLSHAVWLCRRAGSFPLVFGGDHSLTFAAVRGLGAAVDVLHIDAHSDIMEADINLLPASGSVMRALLHEEFVRRVVTVGVRGIFQVEQRPLRDGHTIVSVRRFREIGPQGVAELVSGPCYISFDLDALDPSVAPGVNRPVPGGLSADEVHGIFRAVARKTQVIGADIVELSPRHDQNMRTARLGAELGLRLLAEVFSNQGVERNGKLAAAMQSR